MADFTVIKSGGLFGQNLASTGNGLKDIDGDGTADVKLVFSLEGTGFGALDRTNGYGLGVPGPVFPAWTRNTDGTVVADGVARNQSYWTPGFRGNIANSDDNWSKVNFSSGDGWVQWQFGDSAFTVIPLVFVREADGIDLSAAQAYAAVYFPTDLALDSSSVAENSPIGTVVGSFSTTDNSSSGFTYTLVSGSGDTDNSAFTINGNQLKLAVSPDFETKSSYSIRVKTTDPDNETYEKSLIISITDVVENTAPTDLALSTTTVDENVAANTIVGNFSTTDAEGGTFSYALVSGTGSTDNAAFTIDGNQLKINASPDFETQSSYSIRVRTTDADGLSYEEAFTIGVNDLVENTAPTATGETVSTSKNTAITVELADNVSDAESLTGATLNITSTSNGTTSIDQDARLVTFTPAAGFSGTASFNYTITDAGGLSSNAATVTVEVGDILMTGNKSQNIRGNEGNDYISAGNGKDTIQGLGGNDTLLGNNGADTIDGGSGDDLINGGNGPDLLTGGSGRDKFVLTKSAGGDTITDFADGVDWLALSGLSFGQLSIVGSGSNTLIKLGSETLATLTGVNSSLITAADFVAA